MTASPVANGAIEHAHFKVRTIGAADLNAALREGCDDFLEKRGDLIFIGAFYPIISLLVAVAASGKALLPLVFPLMAGLSLLGPLVATGFYELARRREAGLDTRWRHFLDVRKSPAREDIGLVGVLLIVLFAAWLVSAGLIYNAFFDWNVAESALGFAKMILTTPQGWAMMIIDNLVGLGFALIVLVTSFVSLPMLIDKQVDAATAVRTSIAAFNANRTIVLRWGFTVGVMLVIGAIPLLMGLAIVLPILGYATWHLYTKIVVRD
jgi:uncharacterized membrane protein